MAEITVTARCRLAWWTRPYLTLTRLGVWLGLPVNPDVVARDLKRAIKVEVTR